MDTVIQSDEQIWEPGRLEKYRLSPYFRAGRRPTLHTLSSVCGTVKDPCFCSLATRLRTGYDLVRGCRVLLQITLFSFATSCRHGVPRLPGFALQLPGWLRAKGTSLCHHLKVLRDF